MTENRLTHKNSDSPNGIDPQAWLTDILARIAAHPAHRLDELLPWNWTPASALSARAA
jgi:hypothetical protein